MDSPKPRKLKLFFGKKELLLLGVSFLCGLCPIAPYVNPFGLAFVFSRRRITLPVAAGVIISVPFTPYPLIYALLYLLSFAQSRIPAVYAASQDGQGRKGVAAARAAICIAFSAVLALTANPFAGAENFVASLFSFAAMPAFAYMFSLDSQKAKNGGRLCALLAFSFVLTRAVSVFSVGFFAPAIIFAFFLTLSVAHKSSYTTAGLFGFVCSLGADIRCMPALIVTGLLFGLFSKKRFWPSLFAVYAFAVTANAYLLDFRDLAPLLVNSAAGLGIFIPLRNRLPAPLLPESTAERTAGAEKTSPFSLSAFSACFASLSQVFYTVNAQTGQANATETCRRVQQATLAFCAECASCSFDKRDLCNNLMKSCITDGCITEEKLPDHVRFGCRKKDALVSTVNLALSRGRDERDRAVSVLAEEYSAFSHLLNSACRKQENESIPDKESARRVRELLFAKGIICDRVKVFGTRRRTVEANGVTVDKMDCTSRQLSQELSVLLGSTLSEPRFIVNDGYVTMLLETVCRFGIESAKASCAKDGETTCGDTVSFFEHDDCFYSLIADGMGSGRDAALCSRLAAIYLEKLLCVGADKSDALNMLNKVLMAKKDEVFTTIDLLEIDKLTGEAVFVKAGAAPSFLLRDGNFTRIESRTLPTGIIPDVKAEQIRLQLKKGDFLIMLSDGVTQNRNYTPDDPAALRAGNAKEMLTALMRRASVGAANRDDVSVTVLRIF